MFQKMKNIDAAFKQVRLFSLAVITLCLILTLFLAYKSYQLATQSQQRIFILANGKALEAYAADRKDNVPVEARDHVKMFHQYFFTLDPDEIRSYSDVFDNNDLLACYVTPEDPIIKYYTQQLQEKVFFCWVLQELQKV